MSTYAVVLCLFAVALGARIPNENNSELEEYIVGGNATKIEDVPHQIGLYKKGKFSCGGSIVSATHVVTAAHCVEEDLLDPEVFSIRAGSSNRIGGGVTITAKKVVIHSKYSALTMDYDVAVIELAIPLKFNKSIKAVPIADTEPKSGELVRVSGWGCLKEGGGRPAQLQSVLVPVVKRKTCEINYAKYMTITNRMICAGVEGKDSCLGDTGGPLTSKGKLVGIVASGLGCGRKDFPGIYTNVADPELEVRPAK